MVGSVFDLFVTRIVEHVAIFVEATRMPLPSLCFCFEIPPALWATGGLEVVSIKITPLPTLSPGLRSGPLGSGAGEHPFH